MFRRRKHQVPGLNTTSTADISFMLLIFFLVASSMDIDKGLSRQLPPLAVEKEQDETPIQRERLLQVVLTPENKVLLDGKIVGQRLLQQRIYQFISSRGAAHLVTIEVPASATYDAYFQLQDALAEAYKHWRDKEALRLFHQHYALLTPPQRDKIRELCPQCVSETYPTTAKEERL